MMNRSEVETLLERQRMQFEETIKKLEQKITDSQKDNEERVSNVIASLEYSQADILDLKTKLEQQVKQSKTYSEQLDKVSQEKQLLE